MSETERKQALLKGLIGRTIVAIEEASGGIDSVGLPIDALVLDDGTQLELTGSTDQAYIMAMTEPNSTSTMLKELSD